MALMTVEEIDTAVAAGTLTPKQAEDFRFLVEHFGPEELHEDLKPYLQETSNRWMALRHPLVYVVPWFDAQAKQANAMYAYKQGEIAVALAEKDWAGYIWLHERPYRPEALLEIADLMDDDDYWDAVRDVWIDTENLWQWGTKKLRRILEANRPGRAEGLMDDMERANLAQMTQRVTIYRGYPQGGTRKGWSWTLNRRRAEWFANRYTAPGDARNVIETTIDKDDIIAVFHGRNEAEVIIDPRSITGPITLTKTIKEAD